MLLRLLEIGAVQVFHDPLLAGVIWLQTMVPQSAGDTVELQGYFRVADGYFAADHTSLWLQGRLQLLRSNGALMTFLPTRIIVARV